MDAYKFIPECEVFHEGGPNSLMMYDKCKKNPGHPSFIPAEDFTVNHLPVGFQSQALASTIQDWCRRTVKVTINCTSPQRPDTYPNTTLPYPYGHLKGNESLYRCGTGFIYVIGSFQSPIIGEKCPCPVCKESGIPKTKYWPLKVLTATHVIYDDFEASKTVFECFYDSENRDEVKYLYGLSVMGEVFGRVLSSVVDVGKPHEWGNSDVCIVKAVTHDDSLIEKLLGSAKSCIRYADNILPMSEWGVVISHPHGHRKQVTVGNIVHYTVLTSDDFPSGDPRGFGLGAKCRLPVPRAIKRGSDTVEELPRSNDKSITASTSTSIKVLMNSPSQPVAKYLGSESSSRRQYQILDPNQEMTVGEQYYLPPGMKFTIPHDSDYFCRAKKYRDDYWITFPPETVFTTEDGKDVISLPATTEFYWKEMSESVMNTFSKIYMLYDIDTCPGSSGAVVLNFAIKKFVTHMAAHAGTLDTGLNRSGLHAAHAWTLMPFV